CDRSYKPWSQLGEDGRVSIRSDIRDVSCRARALLLKDERNLAIGEWHFVEERFVFENDIVEVECTRKARLVYKFLHSQVWTGEKRWAFAVVCNYSSQKQSTAEKNTSKPPSVYIMLMDSFADSHARRVFPKTLQYLREEFGSVSMHHVNKVGENSRPNGFAFLMG
ncbi:hypothetical protein PFISCL1PPCAC_9292, partial [Pristionchus fissidentatus]